MSCQVGNPEARDAAKHSAVFVLRSALAAVVPTAGVMVSAHYDKRGAKIAIQYAGEDCSAMKDRVQEECTKICELAAAMDSIQLSSEDKASMAAGEVVATTTDIGGVTVKKFASNAAKAQISVEFILGAPKAAAAAAPAAAAAGGAKKVAAKGKAGVAATVAPPSAYDSVPQVSEQLIGEIMALLAAEGLALGGKEAAIKAKLADTLSTPLVSLKNTAYTSGYVANMCNKPVSNWIVQR
ncbi:hypothetical protein T484DRAFT_1928446 [Baffinella frigidus]|nr:hypothetical protein T484DRAFT_1928446 [Cryptophyta sp. CCMP2293]|eukprot:CAMPEP_0180162568 /NCGR_PEP_ID=MMETSP0986-20121125/29293_1 /TAXON_ID=697907 /ORGANISM="non described non described, Strain CCMP2293" /LENGTH=238 /DNA_ID=CAMNT_0022113061 /DNA_START=65 /DNA_END=784 /DNA_ORIENTATION=-